MMDETEIEEWYDTLPKMELLRLAAKNGSYRFTKLAIIRYGGEYVQEDYDNALIEAALNQHQSIVLLLLHYGASSYAALDYASNKYKYTVKEALLGAPVLSKNAIADRRYEMRTGGSVIKVQE